MTNPPNSIEPKTRVTRIRRIERGPEEWSAIVSAWRKSGMTATAYAKQHDLGLSSLWRWSRRLPVAPPSPAHALPKLVPIELASRRATIEPPRASVDLELASGHLLRLRGQKGRK